MLPDDWATIATVIREAGRKVFGESPGQKKKNKKRKPAGKTVKCRKLFRERLAKKKGDSEITGKS